MATLSLGDTAKVKTLICDNLRASVETTLADLSVTNELTVGSGITMNAATKTITSNVVNATTDITVGSGITLVGSSKTVTANVLTSTTTLRAEKSLEITPGPGLGTYITPYEFTVDAAINCATLPSHIEVYGYSATENKFSYELQFPFSDATERVSLFISSQQIQPVQGAVEDCRLVSTMVSPVIGSLSANLLVECQFSQVVELTQRQKVSNFIIYN
jgi:hypothetical protein